VARADQGAPAAERWARAAVAACPGGPAAAPLRTHCQGFEGGSVPDTPACLQALHPHPHPTPDPPPQQVAALGKSGVSVGYFDSELAAARAYDRAAIGLLGLQGCESSLNFSADDYASATIPDLQGKTREEVKALLKDGRGKVGSGAASRQPARQLRSARWRGRGGAHGRQCCGAGSWESCSAATATAMATAAATAAGTARQAAWSQPEHLRGTCAGAAPPPQPPQAHLQLPRRGQQQPQGPVAGAHYVPGQGHPPGLLSQRTGRGAGVRQVRDSRCLDRAALAGHQQQGARGPCLEPRAGGTSRQEWHDVAAAPLQGRHRPARAGSPDQLPRIRVRAAGRRGLAAGACLLPFGTLLQRRYMATTQPWSWRPA
jgi:hypothetical protein